MAVGVGLPDCFAAGRHRIFSKLASLAKKISAAVLAARANPAPAEISDKQGNFMLRIKANL